MSRLDNIVILIPAYQPEAGMIDLLSSLRELGLLHLVVVDDGGGETYAELFDKAREMGCVVAVHEKNRGKGAAIRTGILTAVEHFGRGIGIVTADADGQHLPSDIYHVATILCDHPHSLVMGVRNFGGEDVPWKSYWGNHITAGFFHLTTGVRCGDTQTGLRGIPSDLLDLALTEEGDRYDYEMNFLTDAVKRVPLEQVQIRTVYENDNKGSHFHPVKDSLRIYKRPLKKAAVCAGAAGLGILAIREIGRALRH